MLLHASAYVLCGYTTDRELRKVVKHKVTLILTIAGTFGMVQRKLVKRLQKLEIRGRTETSQTTALLKSVRILRRVLEIRGRTETSQTTALLKLVRILRRVLDIRGRTETSQTTALLKSVGILRRVLDIRRRTETSQATALLKSVRIRRSWRL